MRSLGPSRNGEWPSPSLPWNDIYCQEGGEIGRADILGLSPGEVRSSVIQCLLPRRVDRRQYNDQARSTQTNCLFLRVPEPFEDFECFLRLLYPFLGES